MRNCPQRPEDGRLRICGRSLRLLLILMLAIFIVGCQQKRPNWHQYSIDEKLANEIMAKAAAQLKIEKSLCPCGSGGQMMDEIKMLSLSFNYYKEIEIKEGRALLITAVDTLLSAINADPRIHPYLCNSPFEPKNIEIRIFLRNPDSSQMASGKLSAISALGAILEYQVNDPSTPLFKTIYKETYDEALVQKE